jgi:hypothetical protein
VLLISNLDDENLRSYNEIKFSSWDIMLNSYINDRILGKWKFHCLKMQIIIIIVTIIIIIIIYLLYFVAS